MVNTVETFCRITNVDDCGDAEVASHKGFSSMKLIDQFYYVPITVQNVQNAPYFFHVKNYNDPGITKSNGSIKAVPCCNVAGCRSKRIENSSKKVIEMLWRRFIHSTRFKHVFSIDQ